MHFYFDEAAIWANKKRNVIHEINQSGLPLILFGKAAAYNHAFLDKIQVPVSYICDNNPAKWGTKLWGMEVIAPARLQDLYSAYNVLILVPFEHQIIPQLNNLPVPPTVIFRLDLYFEEEETTAYFQSMQSALEKIYDCLADQKSRDTYEAVIRYRINRDPEFLSQIALPRAKQYFPQSLGDNALLDLDEVFVDAGAFTGDTVQAFCAAVHGQYRAIYAYEPDAENFKELSQNIKSIPNSSCRQTAVSDQAGEIRFVSDDSGSKIDVAGGEVVPADTLDHLLGDAPVTYLKMDVEGMECAALRGAEKLIQTYHPKLAICTYHSNSDMIQVPELILKLDPSYRLYFRHYTNALVETVCYAV